MNAPIDGQLPDAEFLFLRNFLRAQMGYELGPDKRYLVENRLAQVAATFGHAGVAELIRQLRASDDRLMRTAVIDAMAINETYFFRAIRLFETLRRRIIPTLQVARGISRCLRIWCAGCATGQEPYSIAMTIAEHFPELKYWSVQILATDISDMALDRGRQGTYNQFEIQRGLPVQIMLKYFNKVGDQWQVGEEMRRAVQFRKFNLLDPFAIVGGPFDIIMIRNVLIYFDRSMLGVMFDKLRQTIANDGYLILGESETIVGLTDKFTIPNGESDYYAPTPLS
jgi:chemotaxis protein methyltransferase CheR